MRVRNLFILVFVARDCLRVKSWPDAVIRVYDPAGNVIEVHEHKGALKEW